MIETTREREREREGKAKISSLLDEEEDQGISVLNLIE